MAIRSHPAREMTEHGLLVPKHAWENGSRFQGERHLWRSRAPRLLRGKFDRRRCAAWSAGRVVHDGLVPWVVQWPALGVPRCVGWHSRTQDLLSNDPLSSSNALALKMFACDEKNRDARNDGRGR